MTSISQILISLRNGLAFNIVIAFFCVFSLESRFHQEILNAETFSLWPFNRKAMRDLEIYGRPLLFTHQSFLFTGPKVIELLKSVPLSPMNVEP
jgi:hypothetical protein